MGFRLVVAITAIAFILFELVFYANVLKTQEIELRLIKLEKMEDNPNDTRQSNTANALYFKH